MKPVGEWSDRFLSNVDKSGPCWTWTASRDQFGYGHFWFGPTAKDRTRAHRASWILHSGGPIPDGLRVCHHCDNPSCVRPDHLFLGSQSDNLRDCAAKGRQWMQRRSECSRGHSICAENTYVSPSGARECALCRRERYLVSREVPKGKKR